METPILLKTPEVVIRWYTFRGSSSLLVNKAHQESIQNTFTRTRSDFLMCVHNSAILDSPKVRVSLILIVLNTLSSVLAELSYGYPEIGEPRKTLDMQKDITKQIRAD